MANCEFCNEPATFTERTKPFKLLDGSWSTNGKWPTCNVCHSMIENNERAALLARTINANEKWVLLPRINVQEAFRLMLDGFWENKL